MRNLWSALAAPLLLLSAPALAQPDPTSVSSHETVLGHGGVPLAVQEWGNPDGPPILLIHGFSFSAVSWKNQIGEIAQNARIIAFDLRGHGMSGKPWHEADYSGSEIWADDVAAVLEAKGVERPTIVGWSFGGFVAVDYLKKCGADCASGLVLVGSLAGLVSPPPPPDPEDFGMPPSAGDVRVDDYHSLFQGIAWTARIMTNEPPPPLNLLQKQLSLAMTPPYVRRAMTGKSLDNRDVANCLDLPVLVIRGKSDGTIPKSKLQELMDVLPNARSIEYSNVGHSPFEERPERFNRDLLDFVRVTQIAVGQ
jgi:non-heme chloroperoxidase